jgi:hypothetical protein
MAVTQHRTGFFLTGDLAVRLTVFDHHCPQVPDSAWEAFERGWRHAHGSDVPGGGTITGYVTGHAGWTWDTTFTDGTVVIGDPDGPLSLESEPAGPGGCRIVFWDDGTPYDTGLRVWEGEAGIIAALLREHKDS